MGEKKNQNPCVQITLVKIKLQKSPSRREKKKKKKKNSKVQRNQIIQTSVELIDQ